MEAWGNMVRKTLTEMGISWRQMRPRNAQLPLYAIMRMASLGHAPQEGWNFLEERRCVPGTVREAYEVLSRYHLEDVERLQVQQMRAGLKEELLSAPDEQAQERRRRVFALMRELQGRRRMTDVKGKDGKALVRASEIARAFKHFWQGVMTDPGLTRQNPGSPRNPLSSLPLFFTVFSSGAARSRPSDGCSTYTVPVS